MCSNCDANELKPAVAFEHKNGKVWVVEHDGMLRTGPFSSEERAREWFRRELEREI